MQIGSAKTNYAYATARVQAKRAKLIPPSEYEKLLKMDVSEITRYIQESAYKDDVDELSGRFGGLDLLEAALAVNEERTFHDVRKLLDGDAGRLLSLWMMRHLVKDIKTVLRGKQGGAPREQLLKELLLENLDTYNIFDALLGEDVKTFADVADALERQGGVAGDWGKVLKSVPAEAGLAQYEDALDKAYYGHLVEELHHSKAKGASLVLDFVRREIDARNIQNAARWVANQQKGDFSIYVIPGGKHIKVADAMALAKSEDLNAFRERLAELKLPAAVLDALADAAATRRLSTFQAALHKWHLAELDKMGHSQPLSIIPILLYLTRKDLEVVRLRSIARGKAAGLSEERLRELVA